ncbi:MAG TPA: choice-of-anchor I family protein [Chitinophagaceae bacterium]|nr:choice-of-anchor I family protein [Chitinophagaceae bacterium]
MKKNYLLWAAVLLLAACTKKDLSLQNTETDLQDLGRQPSIQFSETGSIDIGNTGAAEISAFDPLTDKLFVVNNSAINKIDVIDLADPTLPVLLTSIPVASYGGFVNSVAVSDGKLAAAIEASDKVSPGKVAVFNTSTYQELAVITVGSLPDMVTFSPDGRLILTANEGEPNQGYTIDPHGSVSIIDVQAGYAVVTLDFSSLASQQQELMAKGFRIYGPGASFAEDIEPEYIAVAANSRTAWVSLQENNGIARLDLVTKTITDIFPLGFKDFNLASHAIDPSDQDGGIFFNSWPVKGIYMPDALAVSHHNGMPFIYSANEGDAREYTAYVEARRVNSASVQLDPTAFPNAAALKTNAQLGRLNITSTLGDKDGDGDYDELYAPGARSFSIWNGLTGQLIFDSKNELDLQAVAAGKYPDSRSDDKSTEPEGLAIGRVGNNTLLFVGLERADAIAVYNITNPVKPVFHQWLNAGIGPEGVLFVEAEESPTGRSLLIVSSEVDGIIKIYTTPAF